MTQDCRYKWNWFTVVDNKPEQFYLRNLYLMISIEWNEILSLCKCQFVIIFGTLLHSITLLYRDLCSDRMLCGYVYSFYCGCKYVEGTASSNAHNCVDFRPFSFLCVVLLATCASSWSLVRRSPTECVCVCVCAI